MIKIQIKTLSQLQFEIEVDPQITILKLKEMISAKHSHEVGHQVLIFSGKVLANENTLESYKIKHSDFLVLMIKKPPTTAAKPAQTEEQKPTPAPSTSNPRPQPQQTQSQPQQTQSQPQQTQNQPQQPQIQPQQTQPQQGNLYNQSASALISGSELQAAADSIAAMGFPRDRVLLALQASFGNPDRALDYLLNGIPQNLMPPANPRPNDRPPNVQNNTPQTSVNTQTPTAPPQTSDLSGGELSNIWTGGVQLPVNLLPPNLLAQSAPVHPAQTGEAVGLVDYLRNHPAFPEVLQIAQNDPERLQEIMNRLIQQNPQLLTLIQQNQEEFRELLSGGMPQGGGAIQIRVTPHDEESVNRLIGLGFSRNKALEAYFLFEKDEQMAANYLLSYGFDEDEMEFIDEEDDDDEEE